MRAPHEGSLTPGKFVPSMKCGFVAWGSQSHLKTKFEVYCTLLSNGIISGQLIKFDL